MASPSADTRTRGEEREVVTLLRRSLGAAALGIAGVVATVGLLYVTHERSEGWVRHSREVGRVAAQALSLATDRETGIRGYLLTGDSASLAPDIAALVPLKYALDSLSGLTIDNAAQHGRALRIRQALERWDRGYAAPIVAAPARPLVAPGTGGANLAGKALFDGVRSAFADFIDEENALYSKRVLNEGLVRRIALGAVGLEALLLAGAFFMLRRQLLRLMTRVGSQQQELEDRAVELEHQAVELEEQAAELEQQTQEAQTMAEELEETNEELARAAAAEHRALEKLAGEQAFLRRVIDLNPHFVFAKDRQGRFTLVNQAVADAYGTTVADLIGKTDADFNPNREEVEAFRRADLAVMDTLAPLIIPEESITDAAGRLRWLQTTKCPIVGDDGRADQILGVATDITERKRLESQLLQAQKMEAVGQLAGGVAHDFNNLLTVITSYSALALDSLGPTGELREDVLEIKTAAERAARLTRQLLTFSRKQMVQPQVLDLRAVVTELDKMLRRLIREDIELQITVGPTSATVSADGGQLEQVIVNLALNARDAMPDGGRLLIETANVELGADNHDRRLGVAPGPYVMLAVSDTGAGMNPETMAHLFEPFFTTKGPGKGTGLGLSTVYGIVKQAGGDLWVYSEPGQGTTVKIYLPLLQGEVDAPTPKPKSNGNGARGSETILLVEDDAALRALARKVLAAAGYTVLEAYDGENALAVCERHAGRIHLLATDIVMPGISGRALVERLVLNMPEIKVLFMSGYTDDDIVRRGIAGASATFLQKPFTPEVLARKVREALSVPARR